MQVVQCPTCGKSFPAETTNCPDDNTSLLVNTMPDKNLASRPKKVDPPALKAGDQVGEYIVEKKIGQGGMGEVWSARHPKIGKRAAIKILSSKLISSEKAVTRFSHEALAVNEIQHRHIVDIFSFGELPDGKPYFIMEYLSGKSLGDYIKENGVLSFSEILEILGPVCRALHAAHEHGIVHRDLKPDNIFLVLAEGEKPFPKVLDFGIAKLSGDTNPEGKSLTGTGAVMGTASYMSPEQCEGAKAVDARSDIYSLGVVLFEMITGRTPFAEPGDGIGLVISKHIHFAVPSISAMVQGREVPPAVEAFITGVLSKKPEERPANCLLFYSELQKAIGDKKDEAASAVKGAKPVFNGQAGKPEAEARSQSTGDFYTGSSREQKGAKRSSKAPALIGLSAAVLLIVALGYFLLNPPPKETTSVVNTLPNNTDPATIRAQPAKTQPTKEEPLPTTKSAPTKPAPEVQTKKLIVIVNPTGATVSLNGESKEASPIADFDVPYGKAKVSYTIEKEGYTPETRFFVPMGDDQQTIDLKVAKKPSGVNKGKTEKPKSLGEDELP